jgi:hypothetical protein
MTSSTLDRFQIYQFDTCGLAGVIESSFAHADAVPAPWRLDDLVAAAGQVQDEALSLFDHYCAHGEFPNRAGLFSDYAATTKKLLEQLRRLNAAVSSSESQISDVSALQRFRENLARIEAIIAEDDFATDASLKLGGLSDWN